MKENIDVSIQVRYYTVSSLYKFLNLFISRFINSKIKFEINIINNEQKGDLMKRVREKFPDFSSMIFIRDHKFTASKARGKFLLFAHISSVLEEKKPRFRFLNDTTGFNIIQVYRKKHSSGQNQKDWPVATSVCGSIFFIEKKFFNTFDIKDKDFKNCNIYYKVISRYENNLEYKTKYFPLKKRIETVACLLSLIEKILKSYRKCFSFSKDKDKLSLRERYEEIYRKEYMKREEKNINKE